MVLQAPSTTDFGNVFKAPDRVNNVSWQRVLSVSKWDCVTQYLTFRQKNGERRVGTSSKARLHCVGENGLEEL